MASESQSQSHGIRKLQSSRIPQLRSLHIALDPDIAEHVTVGLRMPRKTTLYQFRQNVDYCSMLWARKHLFAAGLPRWVSHLRLDSSPQFARNYLVGELDRIDLSRLSSERPDDVLIDPRQHHFVKWVVVVRLGKRLGVVCVRARAFFLHVPRRHCTARDHPEVQ